MMRRYLVLAAVLALAGCGSPSLSYFTLAPSPGPAVAGAPASIAVRHVGLPDYLDRQEIVRNGSAYRVDFVPDVRWAESLGTMLERVLVQDLAARLPGTSVYSESGAITAAPAEVLEVQMIRFDSDPAGAVVLQAQVSLKRPDASAAVTRTVTLRLPPEGAGTTDYVAALSRALGQLADAVAQVAAQSIH